MARLTLIICLLVFALGSSKAHAGEGTDAVRKRNDAIRVLLRQQTVPGSERERELRDAIAREVGRLIDCEAIGRLAMRDNLNTVSRRHLKKFQRLFRELIEQSYTKALRSRLTYEVEFIAESGTREREVVTEVHTTRRGRPLTVKIDYRLRKANGSWRVYDVVTDGASLVENYRGQFNRIISKEGMEGLLDRMLRRRQEFQ